MNPLLPPDSTSLSSLTTLATARSTSGRISPHGVPAKSLRSATVGLVVASLLGAGLLGCHKPEATTASIRPALTYKITADAGLETEVYSGELRARIEADHAFRVGGKIVKRLVDVGSTVKRGQTLAQIDPQDVTLNAEAATAQVAAFKTEADFAEAEAARFRGLFTKGFVSQSALDQKVNVANAAKSRLAAQQAQANVSANQAGYASLVAAIDGVVTAVTTEVGQVVSAGQTVLRVANPSEKELVIGVPESQLADFRARMKGPLMVGLWANPGVRYPAKVRELGSAADPATRTYPARISVLASKEATEASAAQLGMSGYVVFAGARAPGEIAVPLSAIYIRDQLAAPANNPSKATGTGAGPVPGAITGVWQVGADGKVTLRAIEVSKYTETAAIIRAVGGTLKPGDVIVAAGVHKLREGDVVKPMTDPTVKGDGKVAHAVPLQPATPPANTTQFARLTSLFN